MLVVVYSWGWVFNHRISVLLRWRKRNYREDFRLTLPHKVSDAISVLDLVGVGQVDARATEPVKGFLQPKADKFCLPFFLLQKLAMQGGSPCHYICFGPEGRLFSHCSEDKLLL